MTLEAFLDFRSGIAGRWSDGADRRSASLLSQAIAGLAGDPARGVAIAAIGGFGKGSLALRSDVDLLFLHSGREPADLVRRVLRPLWDANLKTGQMTHTPRTARTAAASTLDTACSLLSHRLLWGDSDLHRDFADRMTAHARRDRALLASLREEETARRRGEPRLEMAFDLKRGRGGLRSLDALEIQLLLEGAEPSEADADLRSLLNAVRSGLHAAARRPHDVYDFELREAVGRYLDRPVDEIGRRLLECRMSIDERHGRATSPPKVTSWDEQARDHVAGWLRSGRASATGVAALIPEWGHLVAEPHVVAFHRHPVGEHSLLTVEEVFRILDSEVDAHLREVVLGVEDPETLIWGALLHDIGKGHEGDHSREGAEAVRVLGPRLGFERARAARLTRLVEHHLLLADLGVRFDSDDPAVLAWAADRIDDLETLRQLYLLTVADSRATGSDTWNPWRATLVQRAYRALERELGRRVLPESVGVELLADQVLVHAGEGVEREEVVRHLAGLTDVYRSAHAPELILEHVLIAREHLGPAGLTSRVIAGNPTRLVLSANDRPGLLMEVAGVLALHRLSIVDARFATRFDSRVFDTFDVVDAGGAAIERSRMAAVEEDLARVIRGGFSFESDLAARRHAYRDTQKAGVDPVVRVERAAAGTGRVEVECADRVGLLHDLGAVFVRFRMPVTRARIDTRSGVAYDTFYVGRLPADPQALVEALVTASR